MTRRVPGTTRRTRLACLVTAAAAMPALAGCGAEEPAAAPAGPAATVTTTVPATATTVPATGVPVQGLPTIDPYAGQPLIERTAWTENVDGARLLVFPTEAGRRTPYPGAESRAWLEILAAAPDADTPGMFDQFRCHWVWARMVQPNKPSWNLEPWRPAVGYDATVQDACNPGGPER